MADSEPRCDCPVAGASAPEPEGAAVPQGGAPEEGGGPAKRSLGPLAVLLRAHPVAQPHLRNAPAHRRLTRFLLRKCIFLHPSAPQTLWCVFTVRTSSCKATFPFFLSFLVFFSPNEREVVAISPAFPCQLTFFFSFGSLVFLHFSCICI